MVFCVFCILVYFNGGDNNAKRLCLFCVNLKVLDERLITELFPLFNPDDA